MIERLEKLCEIVILLSEIVREQETVIAQHGIISLDDRLPDKLARLDRELSEAGMPGIIGKEK